MDLVMTILKTGRILFSIGMLAVFSYSQGALAVEEDKPKGELGAAPILSNALSKDKEVHCIERIAEDLYQVKVEEDLFFVMEKVVDKNYKRWANLADIWQNDVEIDENLWDSIGVDAFTSSILYSNIADVWVAYASNKKVFQINDFNKNTVEMIMTVTTSKDIPFTTHMGISRSPYFIANNLKQHRNISVRLHSFAAQVSLIIDSSKEFMITNPTKVMRKILAKSLSKPLYRSDNDKTPIVWDSKNKIFGLKNERGEIFWKTNFSDDNGLKWFFDHPALSDYNMMSLICVKLKSLASHLDSFSCLQQQKNSPGNKQLEDPLKKRKRNEEVGSQKRFRYTN